MNGCEERTWPQEGAGGARAKKRCSPGQICRTCLLQLQLSPRGDNWPHPHAPDADWLLSGPFLRAKQQKAGPPSAQRAKNFFGPGRADLPSGCPPMTPPITRSILRHLVPSVKSVAQKTSPSVAAALRQGLSGQACLELRTAAARRRFCQRTPARRHVILSSSEESLQIEPRIAWILRSLRLTER